MSDVKVWCNICNELGDHIAPNCPKHKTPHGFGFYDLANDRQMILCDEGEWSGWLFFKHPDGQWVSMRKATDADITAITFQLIAAGWPAKKWQLLAAIIRAWQIKRKLTNPAAAKELGVPLRTYGDWKGGQHAPRGFALKQLREKLKASARHSTH